MSLWVTTRKKKKRFLTCSREASRCHLWRVRTAVHSWSKTCWGYVHAYTHEQRTWALCIISIVHLLTTVPLKSHRQEVHSPCLRCATQRRILRFIVHEMMGQLPVVCGNNGQLMRNLVQEHHSVARCQTWCNAMQRSRSSLEQKVYDTTTLG